MFRLMILIGAQRYKLFNLEAFYAEAKRKQGGMKNV